MHAEPALTGDDIDRSTVRRATEPGTGTPLVLIDLTAEGREAFARVTFEAARVGGRDQVWHHVAIVVGDEIVSFPEIDFDEHPDGIPSVSSLQVSAVDVADARDLVRRLRDE